MDSLLDWTWCSLTSVRREGWLARLAGEEIDACPYRGYSGLWWVGGWVTMDRRIEERRIPLA